MSVVRRQPPRPLTERSIQQGLFGKFKSGSQILMPNYAPPDWYECDMWRVTKTGYFFEYEIKVSVADFRNEHKKIKKMEALATHSIYGPAMFWYVTPVGLLANERLPLWAGLIEVCWSIHGPLVVSHLHDGPRMHKRKVAIDDVEKAKDHCYWRMWAERRRHDGTLRAYKQLVAERDHTSISTTSSLRP